MQNNFATATTRTTSALAFAHFGTQDALTWTLPTPNKVRHGDHLHWGHTSTLPLGS